MRQIRVTQQALWTAPHLEGESAEHDSLNDGIEPYQADYQRQRNGRPGEHRDPKQDSNHARQQEQPGTRETAVGRKEFHDADNAAQDEPERYQVEDDDGGSPGQRMMASPARMPSMAVMSFQAQGW